MIGVSVDAVTASANKVKMTKRDFTHGIYETCPYRGYASKQNGRTRRASIFLTKTRWPSDARRTRGGRGFSLGTRVDIAESLGWSKPNQTHVHWHSHPLPTSISRPRRGGNIYRWACLDIYWYYVWSLPRFVPRIWFSLGKGCRTQVV